MGKLSMQGKFSISISSANDFTEDFDRILSINATNIIRKGQVIGRQQSLYNRWIYSEAFTEDTFSSQFELFIFKLVGLSDKIQSIIKIHDTQVNIYIQSEMGQLGYIITAKTLQLLAELKLDINFHILSFGLVSN